MMQTMTIEWVHTTETHEISVTLSVSDLTDDTHYFVGVDCIDADGMHVRGTVISRHDDREQAVQAAMRLEQIIGWRRDE